MLLKHFKNLNLYQLRMMRVLCTLYLVVQDLYLGGKLCRNKTDYWPERKNVVY